MTGACGGDRPVEVCPRPASDAVTGGDANGDGAADLADPVHLLRHLTEGGAAPACAASADVVPDDRLDTDDAVQLLVGLYERLWTLPAPRRADCPDLQPAPAPACAEVTLALDAPARVAVSDVVHLTLDPGALPVEGWSLSVTAEGCAISAATTDDTAGAQAAVSPIGQRGLGYEQTQLGDEGVTSVVVLDLLEARALEAGDDPLPILALRLAPEGGGCGVCTVSLATAIRTYGRPVDSVLVADGAAYPLDGAFDVRVCP